MATQRSALRTGPTAEVTRYASVHVRRQGIALLQHDGPDTSDLAVHTGVGPLARKKQFLRKLVVLRRQPLGSARTFFLKGGHCARPS